MIRASAVAVLLALMVQPAAARILSFEAFDHKVEFDQERNADDQVVLKVDGSAEVRAGAIYFERFDRLGEMDYLLGLAGTGGNACNPAPFLITLPKSGDPRVFGPVDTCSGVGIEYLNDRIVMREGGYPGDTADVWTWTPSDGIVRTSETLATDEGKGWTDLWDRKVDHPSFLLFNADAAALLEKTAGADWNEVKAQMDGVGDASFVGDFLLSSSALKETSLEAGQFTALDLQTRKAYVALKPVGGKIRVHPVVSEWPRTARQGLKEWAARY